MKRVLLYGGGLQVLSIARSLKACGNITGVLVYTENIVKHSAFVDIYQSFELSIEDSLDTLIECIIQNRYEIIIPTEDEYATLLSKNKTIIEQNTSAKCAIMDWEIYKVASDKAKLLKFCEDNSIPHPKTVPIGGSYDDVVAKVGFPSLIKPNKSVGARGITPVLNIYDLQTKVPQIVAEYGECSLQEFINNDHYYNVMLYRRNSGEYGTSVVTKIIRYYPIKGGSSSCCITIQNKEIINLCKKTLDKLKWVGFADFDVLEKGEGDYRIIEINPRVPASVHAAAVSGVNFGEMIVEDYLNNQLVNYEYVPGRILRYLGLDIAWFISSPERFRTKPSWFNFVGKNIYYQEGGLKDWKAMVCSIYEGIKKQLSPSFRASKANMNE